VRRYAGPLRRAGLAVLAALNLWWGVAALVAPARFFAAFPFGHTWTGAYPPYNEHLVVDLGATFTTLAVLAGVGTFNTLHLAFHATHPGRLAGGEYAASVAALVAGVLAPVVLAALAMVAPAVRRHDPPGR
jgi:hypothetical protein